MMKQKRANDECSKKHLLESHPENPLPTCYSIYIIIYILYIIYILLYNYYYKIFLQVKKPFSTSFGPTLSVFAPSAVFLLSAGSSTNFCL